MQSELGNGHSQEESHDLADNSLFESVTRVEHDVDDLIGALALLGVKRCSQCRQFFRSAEPGALGARASLLPSRPASPPCSISSTRCTRPPTRRSISRIHSSS